MLNDDNKKIFYSVGGAGYYMGDMKEGVVYHHQFPDASIIEQKEQL
ncbi:hypothetical protein [Anaerotignum propionicum]|nr:hypothetical protein [Anaerotignum propionicum]MCQ4936306.1 hypothetical protein [Anaerotignum propionicum]